MVSALLSWSCGVIRLAQAAEHLAEEHAADFEAFVADVRAECSFGGYQPSSSSGLDGLEVLFSMMGEAPPAPATGRRRRKG